MSDRHTSADEITFTRVFNAPRALVFKAWTDPERLAQWWGPKGSKLEVLKLDFRPGGTFLYSQTMPDGQVMWGKFVYQEVIVPEKLVFINSFSDAQGNTIRAPFNETWPLEVINFLTLTEQDGKTALTLQGGPHNATAEEYQTFASMRPMLQQGFGGTFDQLEEYLAKSQTV